MMTGSSESLRRDPFLVIRSLDKRKREYKYVGWIYILRNRAFKDPLLKIGQSRRPPMVRAEELGTETGVPEGFDLLYFVHVSDRNQAETFVHNQLHQHRKSASKEFFHAPLTVAVEALSRAAEQFPVLIGRRNPQVLPQFFDTFTVRCTHCGTANRVRQMAVAILVRCRKCQASLPFER